MGISPIDMQVTMTKTTEIASKHSSELHKAVADQQKISEKENLKQEENTKKVHDRDTTERIYVDEEDKEKNKKEKQKSKSNNSEESETNDENDEYENEAKKNIIGRHFDASI